LKPASGILGGTPGLFPNFTRRFHIHPAERHTAASEERWMFGALGQPNACRPGHCAGIRRRFIADIVDKRLGHGCGYLSAVRQADRSERMA
jgi:hypothetical protein